MDKLVIKFSLFNKLKKGRKIILKENKKIIEYLLNTENPYKLHIDYTNIEIQYSENSKTFEECIKNILKRRNKEV